jgi:hypothetical protein
MSAKNQQNNKEIKKQRSNGKMEDPDLHEDDLVANAAAALESESDSDYRDDEEEEDEFGESSMNHAARAQSLLAGFASTFPPTAAAAGGSSSATSSLLEMTGDFLSAADLAYATLLQLKDDRSRNPPSIDLRVACGVR